MSAESLIRQPSGIKMYTAKGTDPSELREQILKESEGSELYVQEVKDEESGEVTVFGFPRAGVMDLIYEVSYPLVKIIDDHAAIKVKSNRAVTDFFVIILSRKSGSFIGKHGQTLDALENMASHCISRKFPRWVNLSIDIDNYRRKRNSFLENTVKRIIRDIERDHRERPVKGLLSKERKFVHNYLTDHPYLTTESRGEGQYRTLYIKAREDIRED